jgi:molybdopterin converting factor small subunit
MARYEKQALRRDSKHQASVELRSRLEDGDKIYVLTAVSGG